MTVGRWGLGCGSGEVALGRLGFGIGVREMAKAQRIKGQRRGRGSGTFVHFTENCQERSAQTCPNSAINRPLWIGANNFKTAYV